MTEKDLTARAGGRPSKYKTEFANAIIELGKQGASKTEMASKIGISKETLYEWAKENAEFSDALTEAMQHSQAWWEEKGREATFGNTKGFYPASYIFNMKNRFRDDWQDRVENNFTGSVNVVHHDIDDLQALDRYCKDGEKVIEGIVLKREEIQ